MRPWASWSIFKEEPMVFILSEAPGEYAIMGRYVLSPSVFPLLAEGHLGAGGEIQLTDALRRLAAVEPVWGVVYRILFILHREMRLNFCLESD